MDSNYFPGNQIIATCHNSYPSLINHTSYRRQSTFEGTFKNFFILNSSTAFAALTSSSGLSSRHVTNTLEAFVDLAGGSRPFLFIPDKSG